MSHKHGNDKTLLTHTVQPAAASPSVQTQEVLCAPDRSLARLDENQRRGSPCSRMAAVAVRRCGISAHTDISYVVPPTPVTFLTLLWRLGLKVALWALGWQSICPLTFIASLDEKRKTEKTNEHKLRQ